jgi:fatty acid desaturase
MAGAPSVCIWRVPDCFSFSATPWINDAVGLAVHSFLLTPYFSWKHTHALHHRSTGLVEKDTAFVPDEEQYAKKARD